jgi:hypothetical protein
VPGKVEIKTATEHHSYFVNIVEGIRHQAMVTHQHFKEWGNMFVAERDLGTKREVGEGGIVNSLGERYFFASPMCAGVERESEPMIEIVGKTGPGSARVRFQPGAREREQCSRKLAM